MKHRHGERDRHEDPEHHGRWHRRGHGHHHHHGRGRHGRLFDYGELRLLILAMIAEEPRHGYELIKQIEERFGGSYSPSPGVIYPTLSWLEDSGYAASATNESGRKSYTITEDGTAFLSANREAADELLSRATGEGRGEVPSSVIRAFENLKVAMRLRMRKGGVNQEVADKISAALDAAAQTVERS